MNPSESLFDSLSPEVQMNPSESLFNSLPPKVQAVLSHSNRQQLAKVDSYEMCESKNDIYFLRQRSFKSDKSKRMYSKQRRDQGNLV